MTTVGRYFSATGLLNWPVFLVSTLWAIFVNLVDPANSGTGNYMLRTAVVLVAQIALFSGLYFIHWLVISRLNESFQPFVLLGTIFALSVGRAVLLGELLYLFGATDVVIIKPRIMAALANQGVALVLLTWGYCLVATNEKVRRDLTTKREQLVAFAQRADSERAERNQNFLNQIRQRLIQALAIDDAATPEQTLVFLRTSIDNVVKPLARALNQRNEAIAPSESLPSNRIQWSLVLKQTMDIRFLQIIPTMVLFSGVIIAPFTRLFEPVEGILVWIALVVVIAGISVTIQRQLKNSPYGSFALVPVVLFSGFPGC